MLNKDNYVPWSSRIIRYARSRPNGKMIVDSIKNGPHVRRMITTLGEPDLSVPVPESFHEQTNEELTKNDIKRMDADDQAIQTILLGLLEDIYDAVDSCKTAKEIWECDEVNELKDERLAKTHDPLAFMAHSQNSYNFPTTHKDQSSSSTHSQQSFPINNKYNPQSSLNQNFMQPPMTSLEDINDPTVAMNAALILFAKAFQLSMNMSQDRQIQNLGGNGGNQFGQYARQVNGLVVVPGIANQNGTGNIVAARVRVLKMGNKRGIHLQVKEFDFMATAGDLDKIEEVNANCILMANLQHASTSGTQPNKAPIYDTDGSVENDNHVTFVALSMVQSGCTVETSSAPNEETRVFVPQTTKSKEKLFLSNVSNMVTVSKMISIPNEDLSDETTLSIARKFLNEVKSSLVTLQHVVKQKIPLEVHNWSSSAYKEVHKIMSLEIALIINQVDARVQNFEIQYLQEAAKFVRDFKSLAKEADESLDKQKYLELKIKRLIKASVGHDIMFIVQNGSADVPSEIRNELDHTKEKLELFIIKKEKEYTVLWNNWYTKCEECKFDKILYDKAYNDMQQKVERLQAQLRDLKGKSSDTPSALNTLDLLNQKLETKIVELEFQVVNYEREISHLKTTYKNLFDSIMSNWERAKLYNLIYENAKLRTWLFENTSESMNNTLGMSVTLRVDKPKLIAVTPYSKKLQASIPSHSIPQPREFNVVKHSNRHVTFKENVSSDTVNASSTGLVHTARTRRPQPKYNKRNDRVPSASKSSEVKKNFLGTVRFGNDHVAAILGYGDLIWGNITITRVYFVKGLCHNIFSVGQFCNADLEVAFRRNTCFIRDLDGVDLLKGNRSINLYTINLYDMASASPICLMARATPTKTKDDTPEVIKNFLKKIYVRLQAPVIIVRTDNETKFKNHALKEYLDNVGITHETSAAKTPQQNGVVEHRNHTLVEAARTMLIFSHASLFLWAEAIATADATVKKIALLLKTGVIEFGDSYEAPTTDAAIGSASEGTTTKKGRTIALTTEDMQKRKNDVKARTTLLLALFDEHQLRFKIEQDDLNQKFLTSLAPEWLMHTIVWRSRSDLDTMSLDDLYNHLKVYESEVQKKSESNSQNMAFISSAKNSSGKEDVNTASIPTVSTNVSPASVNIRAKKTGKKISIQGTDVAGFDKSKVECFNCHKMGHFARECMAPRSQDRGRRDNYRQWSKVKEQAPKVLMAIDEVGWDWSFIANEKEDHALVADEEAPTEFALMAKTSAESDVFDNSLCSKNCLSQVEETLMKEKEELESKLTGFKLATKDLDNLIGSHRSDKIKEGLGYSDVPPFLLNSSAFENRESTGGILSKPEIKFVRPVGSPTVIKTNKKETARKSTVKYAELYKKPSKKSTVRGNQRNRNNLKSQQLGKNFVIKEACYNCGGVDHLSYNYRKWVDHRRSWSKNNNTHKGMSPRPAIYRPYRPPMRPVRPNMNVAQPKRTSFHKLAHSYSKSPFQRTSAVRSQFRALRFPTVTRKFPTVNRKFPIVNRKFPTGNTKFSTADLGYWDSSLSRHMTCNISYLSDYEPFDGGYVSFGQGGCKITGKGTIKTCKLEFQNVYFVKDLKYNLFSVSQICDNKNSVMFTNSECIVLGRDFKLTDDTNVLLRTHRQDNMYSIDLNNIVPHKDLTCLVAKAFADKCMLWYRMLGHLNFNTMNKLVRHNLVRDLPTKCFENDHNCTACLKGKQHKASCKTKLVNSVTKPLHTFAYGLIWPYFYNLGKFEAKGDEGYFI
nr:ribonuclease H-like domain-containing protein [Tanacetum cinerariifolium]